MTVDGWLLLGGYFAIGLVVASVVYHLHFARQTPEDGGVVVWLVPLWPVVVAAFALYGLLVGVATVVTFGRCWRTTGT